MPGNKNKSTKRRQRAMQQANKNKGWERVASIEVLITDPTYEQVKEESEKKGIIMAPKWVDTPAKFKKWMWEEWGIKQA